MRDAMTEAGLPLDCRPHGLRKTFGRLLADVGATAHDIMAALGHRSARLSATRARLTVAAVAVTQSQSLKITRRTEFPKPLLSVWGNCQKPQENQNEWKITGAP